MDVCAGIHINASLRGCIRPSSVSSINLHMRAHAILGEVAALNPLLAARNSPKQSVKIGGTFTTSYNVRNRAQVSAAAEESHHLGGVALVYPTSWFSMLTTASPQPVVAMS